MRARDLTGTDLGNKVRLERRLEDGQPEIIIGKLTSVTHQQTSDETVMVHLTFNALGGTVQAVVAGDTEATSYSQRGSW